LNIKIRKVEKVYLGNIIIIGSSTGGTRVLGQIFSSLPQLNATVIIVQHIPPEFDKGLADRLNDRSKMDVALAENGDLLERGKVYLAPARIHLKLIENTRIKLSEGEKVNYCCPSVDVTMCSALENRKGKLIGVVLTGMGKDGADGLTHIKSLNGITMAQDKKTCAVYGMPMEAAKTGNVDFVLTPEQIGEKLIELTDTIRR
jgi:two-component system chemotaxis response regulator CheB